MRFVCFTNVFDLIFEDVEKKMTGEEQFRADSKTVTYLRRQLALLFFSSHHSFFVFQTYCNDKRTQITWQYQRLPN
jgi:hypothetical protein